MLPAPELRICSCDVADTENGVSCTEPARFCAVTTISSSVDELATSAARAGYPASVDASKMPATAPLLRIAMSSPLLIFVVVGRPHPKDGRPAKAELSLIVT